MAVVRIRSLSALGFVSAVIFVTSGRSNEGGENLAKAVVHPSLQHRNVRVAGTPQRLSVQSRCLQATPSRATTEILGIRSDLCTSIEGAFKSDEENDTKAASAENLLVSCSQVIFSSHF
eukprot:Skav201524  [mRNA]  locus=scaffold4878:50902:51258:- [translate_table: standard]